MLDLTNIVSIIVFFVILYLTYFFLGLWKHEKALPEIGTRLPLLGHMHLVGKDFVTQVKTFKERFGPIVTIGFGNENFVIISSFEIAKEVLQKNASTFANRSSGWFNTGLSRSMGIAASNGESWIQHRRFALHALRDFGMGRLNLEDNITEEIRRFTDAVDSTKGAAFDPENWQSRAIANIIGRIVDSKVHGLESGTVTKRLEYIKEVLGVNSMADGLPSFEHLPFIDVFGQKRAQALKAEMWKTYKREIEDHRKNLDPDNIHDIIDAYLVEMEHKKDNSSSTFCEDELFQTIDDLYFAGTHTSAKTLLWAYLYMAEHQQIQDNVRAEILDLLGPDKMPSTRNRADLPYTDATIHEIHRMASIVPISIGNVAHEDTEIAGYHVPAGSVVSTCLHSISRDETLFPDPETFKPERFLKDGKVQLPEHHIPFFMGKRMCPGESLAKMEIFIFFVRMLQRYKIEFDPNLPKPSLDGTEDFVRETGPYKVTIKPLTTAE